MPRWQPDGKYDFVLSGNNIIPLATGTDANRAIRRTIGRRIRKQRTDLGLSLESVAERMTSSGYPVSAQAIGQWERGITTPRGKNQYAIAAALGTTYRKLFDLDEADDGDGEQAS